MPKRIAEDWQVLESTTGDNSPACEVLVTARFVFARQFSVTLAASNLPYKGHHCVFTTAFGTGSDRSLGCDSLRRESIQSICLYCSARITVLSALTDKDKAILIEHNAFLCKLYQSELAKHETNLFVERKTIRWYLKRSEMFGWKRKYYRSLIWCPTSRK